MAKEMDMYQEKMQLRFRSVDEAEAIVKKTEKKEAEKIALNFIKLGVGIKEISQATGINQKRLTQMKDKLNK